jgi:hypothetical protein
MILFDLRCAKGHVFEGWFRDGAAFDAQAASRKVACPVCGSRNVVKAPMAPRIGKGSAAERDRPAEKAGAADKERRPDAAGAAKPTPAPTHMHVVQALRELRRHVEANCDYVGERFAEEARRIHYGETDRRNIYGEASDEEARALDEEGVEFKRIPWVPRHDG